MTSRTKSSARVLLLSVIAGTMYVGPPFGIAAQAGTELPSLREHAPLSLDVAAKLRGHNGRSPISFSPDGTWIAHTIEGHERVVRLGPRYTSTGVPLAEGDAVMEATITRVSDAYAIRLGEAGSSSWAPVWSPDGQRVAFYSDATGEAGLWVWEMESRAARRLGSIVVRPFFGFETPRWTADGRGLAVKILPEGITLADANGLDVRPTAALGKFSSAGPTEPSVWVRRSHLGGSARITTVDSAPVDPSQRQEPVGNLSLFEVDLALVYLDGAVERLVERTAVRDYAFSPDGRLLGFTVAKGHEPASQQPNFDLAVLSLDTGTHRLLGRNLRLGYGIEWSWSPKGTHVAWFTSGASAREAVADGEADPLTVTSVGTGAARTIGHPDRPSFDPGDGEHRPLWAETGERLYGIAGGELWEATLRSDSLRRLAQIDGWYMRSIVARPHHGTTWLPPGGGDLWVMARSTDGVESGFFAVNPVSGASRAGSTEAKAYSGLFSLDGSSETGRIAFVSTDQKHAGDLWTLDVETAGLARVSDLNPGLNASALGSAQVIQWRSPRGDSVSASLLLPPGHRAGEPLPTVVWVYGGSMGSRFVNRFGLWGSAANFNMQVLATRGYAVLFPDVPMGVGSPVADVVNAVRDAVDAAVDLGFADPDRLAIMGQSYGSYNTLAVITESTRYEAAILTGVVIHPDLLADYVNHPAYYEQGQGRMGGSIWEFPERYIENSPLLRFDRIQTPLLIGQGELDGDLGPVEAIYGALDRLEKSVELRVYEGEGHVLTRPAQVIDFWERRLSFLAERLGVKAET